MISAENRYQGTIDAPLEGAHPLFVCSQDERIAVEHPLLSVVDDDESVRESLPDLIKGVRLCGSSFFVGGRVSLIRLCR